ncbi:MAG: LysE family transporter [Kangiellaceae bacterium]|nr:LysE family transporter [Kangiellaceae bacterium]
MGNEFVLLAIAHAFAVASPGADFAVVIKNTLQSGHRAGLYTAIGIGLGILVHVGYTLLGLAVILAQSPGLINLVKYAGALYLAWLAWKSFQSRKSRSNDFAVSEPLSLTSLEAIKQGFVINVLNPKVTVFFVALFTAIVSYETPILIQSFYGLWIVIYTILWFAMVAWLFSRRVVLNWYREHGHYIDWSVGVILACIAIRLVIG